MAKKKKGPVERLSKSDLRILAYCLREILYLNVDDSGEFVYDPDKELDSDTLARIGDLANQFGLTPKQIEKQ